MSKDIRLALQKQAHKIEQLATQANEHINNVRQLREYMTNRIKEFELSATQQAMMKLYEFIYNQLMGGVYTENEVIELTISKAHCSRGEALGYVREAKELFNTTININKAFQLKRELQLNEIYRQKPAELGDMRSVAQFSKVIEKILATIEEDENRDAIFEGHTFQVTADPEVLGIKPPSKEETQKLFDELKERFGYSIEDADIISDHEQ